MESNTVKLPDLSAFAFPAPPPGAKAVRAIAVNPTELITGLETVALENGAVPARLRRIAVVERHGVNGNTAFACVSGVGGIRGAIATSVAHDSHNVIVVGDSDAAMRAAVLRLGEIGGGAVVFSGGGAPRSVAEFPMPIGGLMSDLPAAAVAALDAEFRAGARAVGCDLPEPLTTISFLALPVIPHVKLTDRGLFDADALEFIPLYVS